MKPLTEQDITAARQAVLENARSLVSDAELLLDAGRFPRAFSLAVLACEEMAKLPMLARAQVELLLGHSTDWKRLGERLNDHRAKLGMMEFINGLLVPGEQSDEQLLEVARCAGRKAEPVAALDRQKQDGFYVSLSGLGSRAPSDAIPEAKARGMVSSAMAALAFFSQGEDSSCAGLQQLRDENPQVTRALETMLGMLRRRRRPEEK